MANTQVPSSAESPVTYDSCYYCLAPVEKCGQLCADCSEHLEQVKERGLGGYA